MRFHATAGRLAAGTALLLVAALLGLASPAAADPTVTSFAFTSDPGDYIGQGGSRSYDPSNATFSVRGTAGAVTVSVSAGGEWWTASLASPGGLQLRPGTYQNAARAPFSGASAGLEVTGSGRGCNTLTGSFDVAAVSADSHGQVTSLEATFVQWCDSSTGALHGTIRYQAPPSAPIVLTSSDPATVDGQAFTLSAKVLPGTGPVTFRDGSTVLGTSSAANAGVARWVVETATPGTHTYTASQNASVVSAPITQTVRAGNTSMTYTSGKGEYIGQGATASFASPAATVRASGSSSGATVSVAEGSESWSVTLAPVSGQALAVGSYPGAQRAAVRTAGNPGLDVLGDGRGCNALSGSFAVSRIEFAADGSVSVLDATWTQYCDNNSYPMTGRVRVGIPAATATSVSAGSAVGGPTTLTATVAAASGSPGGSVTFSEAGTALGTVPLDGTGHAALTTTLARGTHTVTAAYSGSQAYAPSQGSTSFAVVGYATSTSLTTAAKGQQKVGRPIAFSVTVTGGPTATGSVVLLDGSTQVAASALFGGTASLTWSPATKGTHTLTARYPGDAAHEPSTSAPVTVKVG